MPHSSDGTPLVGKNFLNLCGDSFELARERLTVGKSFTHLSLAAQKWTHFTLSGRLERMHIADYQPILPQFFLLCEIEFYLLFKAVGAIACQAHCRTQLPGHLAYVVSEIIAQIDLSVIHELRHRASQS